MSKGQIKINLKSHDGRTGTITVPTSLAIKTLLAEIQKKWSLKLPPGHVAWVIADLAKNKEFSEKDTLATAEVSEGDTLMVRPIIEAAGEEKWIGA